MFVIGRKNFLFSNTPNGARAVSVKSSIFLYMVTFNDGINIGDKVRFYEIVMGMDYDVTGTIIAAQRDKDHFSFVFFNDKNY